MIILIVTKPFLNEISRFSVPSHAQPTLKKYVFPLPQNTAASKFDGMPIKTSQMGFGYPAAIIVSPSANLATKVPLNAYVFPSEVLVMASKLPKTQPFEKKNMFPCYKRHAPTS